MAMTKQVPKNMDDYIDRFPKEVQQLLKKMRLTIKKAAPQAKETIGYGIPAFTLNGMLVWFAAFQSHIGFYPRFGDRRIQEGVVGLQRSQRVGTIPVRRAAPAGSGDPHREVSRETESR